MAEILCPISQYSTLIPIYLKNQPVLTEQEKQEGFMVPEFLNDRINDRFILKLAQPFWNLQDIPHAAHQVSEQVTHHERRKYLHDIMQRE